LDSERRRPRSDSDSDVRWRVVERVVAEGPHRQLARDHLAREEPLEIRVQGVAIAVVMRTPGHDEELVRGFLVSEGILASPDHIARLAHCDRVNEAAAEDNVMLVRLREGIEIDLASLRRNLYASSSCGICGRASIAGLLRRFDRLPAGPQLSGELLYELPDRMRAAQEVFEQTGGLHAAAWFSASGELLVLREDIGRHNAVDKVLGHLTVRDPRRLAEGILLVSGRISFELVQKAIALGVRVLAGISAPSSLAVELATAANLTVIGFLRGRQMSIYAAAGRIA
jgi:FdhD protein